MSNKEKNYSLIEIGSLAHLTQKEFNGEKGKFFLGKELGLTGCEVSLNSMLAGKSSPFVHSHKLNEELYIFLSGKGTFYVDGEEFTVQEGSMIRIASAGERSLKALEELSYICVQAQSDSLTQSTFNDGIKSQVEPSWIKNKDLAK